MNGITNSNTCNIKFGSTNTKAKSPTLYQNGVIDLFKQFKVYDLNSQTILYNGEVQAVMDPEIGRKTIKITGNLSATNYIELPNSKYIKSLNVTGKFYYFFIKTSNDKKFSLQLDFITTNEVLIKFTFKFPLKNTKFTRSSSYNIDIPLEIPNSKWSIIKFDPVEYINQNFSKEKEFSTFRMLSESTILRSIRFNSTIIVRGIYIMNNSIININAIPKEMSIKDVSGNLSNILNWMSLQQNEPLIQDTDSEVVNSNLEKKKKTPVSNLSVIEQLGENINDKKLLEENKKNKVSNLKFSEKKEEENYNIKNKTLIPMHPDNHNIYQPDLKEFNCEMLKKNMESVNREFNDSKKEIIKNIFKRDELKRKPLLPDPIMNLKFILGYTSTHCPQVKYIHHNKNLLFASGSNLIRHNYTELKQKFFFGHSKSITNFVLACEGEILFSCQEGKNVIIRVWRVETGRCIKMLTTPYEKINSMSISRDSRTLCTVGYESYNKEQIILWDITNLDTIKVSIRQSSHFSINMIKFSPFENSILISCGRENIKFWRIKGDHLGGKAVVLNQYARETNFICLDYDSVNINDVAGLSTGTGSCRAFIGSSKGCIFQVSCSSQELEAIYKIQDTAILAICVCDAFCATGSYDGFLRIWPIDFKEFIIEAQHDSPVCSVDISHDAFEIICGTINGSIGILDIQTKNYKTLLRTPPSRVQVMLAHPSGDYLFTIEDDKSVRVWDIETKSEAFQFLSSRDPPTALGVGNHQAIDKDDIFACGFHSGVLKIFSLNKTSILYETKSFSTAIRHIKYLQKDTILLSMNDQGHMSIHDSMNKYIQIKLIKIDEPCNSATDISLSLNEDYFATIGPESNCAIVWNAVTYGMKNRIPINNFFISKLLLMNKNVLAIILENCNVQFYSLITYEGILVKEFFNVHIKQVRDFLMCKNFKYFISGGDEGMVKVWDMKMIYKSHTSFQQFISHTNGVKAIVCIDQKSLIVSVGEDSGIYFWNFLGDVTFTETEIMNELEKFGSTQNMKEFVNSNSNIKKKSANMNAVSKIKVDHLEKTYKNQHENQSNISKDNINIHIYENDTKDSQKVNCNVMNMLPITNEDDFGVDMSMCNVQKSETISNFFKTCSNKNFDESNCSKTGDKLLFSAEYIPNKTTTNIVSSSISNKLSKRLILGNSTSSTRNLILNKRDQWFAFTVNNKVVVEFLEENRNQIILEDHFDEISCLASVTANTSDNTSNYLVSGSGLVNKEEFASICIWDTESWKLKKKLKFHYKGVQLIKLSQDSKYMISAGTNEEKSICIWNLSNFTVIDSKSLKFPIVDIAVEKDERNGNYSGLYFVSISYKVLSFWKMDMNNYKLEGFHINKSDISNDLSEDSFTAIEMSSYNEKYKTSFIILGTSTGAVLILDKEKKVLLRKYFISKTSITKLYLSQNYFICSGESPLIYCWKCNDTAFELFSFIENEKSQLLFVDSDVLSIHFLENEGLVSTNNGSIYYASFASESVIKVISAHKNSFINSIECDKDNKYALTCGDDGIVRCWTQDTFDQKFRFMFDKKCDTALINHVNKIAGVVYDNSYLRFYNMNTLKSIGKVKIPENDINCFGFIFNYQGLILTTLQDQVFVLDVQNWDPLNILYTDISESCSAFMPKNQFFKSIDTKITLGVTLGPIGTITQPQYKSLVLMAFSDGTCSVMAVNKHKSKIEVVLLDKFNLFEFHIAKSDDVVIAEMYKELTKFRTNYICHAKFSFKFDHLYFAFHECLQFLFIRNYNSNEIYRRIALDYFPTSIAISENENYIAIGTKDGLVLFITRCEGTYSKANRDNSSSNSSDLSQTAFNLDVFAGHYDFTKSLCFSYDNKILFTGSYNEIIVWNIKL